MARKAVFVDDESISSPKLIKARKALAAHDEKRIALEQNCIDAMSEAKAEASKNFAAAIEKENIGSLSKADASKMAKLMAALGPEEVLNRLGQK